MANGFLRGVLRILGIPARTGVQVVVAFPPGVQRWPRTVARKGRVFRGDFGPFGRERE
jgi:hypothetical protein